MLDDVLQRVPVFVLVVFRIAGVLVVAPVFSSPRVLRPLKVAIVLVAAFGVSGGVAVPGSLPRTTYGLSVDGGAVGLPLPDTTWELAVGIGGELAFGLAVGMLVNLVFVAAQWAGEMIGIEMGLNLGEMFDPSMGGGGSLVGDVYYFVAMAVFLSVGGHREMLAGVADSFRHLPLLSLGVDRPTFDAVTAALTGATTLAVRLAAPMLITVLVVDLSLGLVGRAMPQFNVMQAGVSVRSLIGTIVILYGLTTTTGVIQAELLDAMRQVRVIFATPHAPG